MQGSWLLNCAFPQVVLSFAVLGEPFNWRAHRINRYQASPACKTIRVLLNLLIEMLAGRRTMKKISYASCAVVLVLSLVAPIVADTIRLKDGSVIRGQVIGFKDQQFTILIGAGSKG